jgi:AraC-like DNA-binding protein
MLDTFVMAIITCSLCGHLLNQFVLPANADLTYRTVPYRAERLRKSETRADHLYAHCYSSRVRFTYTPLGLESSRRRYRERVSLKDVARAVSLSPGYLTTVVRCETGRTVQEWIAERRMMEARRLLVETNLPVEEVSRQVCYGDAGYFVRSFRRAHGATPLGWRRAGRP